MPPTVPELDVDADELPGLFQGGNVVMKIGIGAPQWFGPFAHAMNLLRGPCSCVPPPPKSSGAAVCACDCVPLPAPAQKRLFVQSRM